MSFSPMSADDLYCRECGEEISLEQYRRFGLCIVHEAARIAKSLPDAPPEWLTERFGV